MSSSDTQFQKFVKGLSELRGNDKIRINELTFIARDHKDQMDIARKLTEAAEKNVYKAHANLKLVSLYVVDSILKNVGLPYKELFADCIVDMFVHAFQMIKDEKGRMKMYNLRNTWKEMFPNSCMYSLDTQVRRIDPAWPIIAKPEDSRPPPAPEPNVAAPPSPGIHVNPKFLSPSVSSANNPPGPQTSASDPPASGDNGTASDSALPLPSIKSEPIVTSINASRDPRLKKVNSQGPSEPASSVSSERKRKLEDPDDSSFLIDRSGNIKMEKIARKKGREEQKQSQGSNLFGKQDQDMRQVAPPSPAAWSSYRESHQQVLARRPSSGDVDMRFESVDPSASTSGVQSAPVKPEFLLREVRNKLLAGNLDATQRDQLMRYMVELESLQQSYPPLAPLNQYPGNAGPSRSIPGPPMGLVRPPMQHPGRGVGAIPLTRGGLWQIEIEGFDDMPQIGVDPRLLEPCDRTTPIRSITIDGRQYTLLLERIQPMIVDGDHLHAVRFRCGDIVVYINRTRFVLPSFGYAFVRVEGRQFTACLGGPGHELIIDGRPHAVPFNGQVMFINLSGRSVGVQFGITKPKSVDILPPIPPQILKWANQRLFGSPKQLHKPPLNPLRELERRQTAAPRPMATIPQPMDTSIIPVTAEMPNVAPPSVAVTNVSATPTEVPPVDIHKLFDNLVAAGLLVKSEPKPAPDIAKYSLKQFQICLESEMTLLYNGHQCVQCGLRYDDPNSDEFTKHMDYHYNKNTNELMENRSRNWLPSARHWLISEMCEEAAPHFDDAVTGSKQEYKCVAFDEPQLNVCDVCNENFETFWDDDAEEWMLRDAILSDGKVYHPICLEDAGKEFTHPMHTETSDEDSKSPVHLTEDPQAALERILMGGMNSILVPSSTDSPSPAPQVSPVAAAQVSPVAAAPVSPGPAAAQVSPGPAAQVSPVAAAPVCPGPAAVQVSPGPAAQVSPVPAAAPVSLGPVAPVSPGPAAAPVRPSPTVSPVPVAPVSPELVAPVSPSPVVPGSPSPTAPVSPTPAANANPVPMETGNDVASTSETVV